jgi:NAD(P)-dependent dehydrogenase (short-subunit alcohol dehydrogenase family)
MPAEHHPPGTDPAALHGKLALVTGAYGGIGLHTVQGLARRGATVIMAGRDPAKLDTAALAVRAQQPDATVDTLALDLADLTSIQQAAAAFLDTGRPLDLLINNAAITASRERRTSTDGFELTFATNHLGHFALTGRLLPALLGAPAARVITVSAKAAQAGTSTDFTSANGYKGGLGGAYATSKLANLVFTQELARRAHATTLTAVATHPGVASTGLVDLPAAARWVLEHLLGWLISTPEQAARPSLYAATHDNLPSAAYIGPTGRIGLSGPPGPVPMPTTATDPDLGRSLWETSERLTHVHYHFNQQHSPHA